MPGEPRFESGDALHTARGYATDPAVRDGVDGGTEDYNYLPEGFVGGSKGYRTPAAGRRGGGAAPQHIRGASPLTLKGGKMDGKKLKKRRMAKGFSRQRLARLSGVSAGEIAKAENGTLELRSPQAARLSAALRSSS